MLLLLMVINTLDTIIVAIFLEVLTTCYSFMRLKFVRLNPKNATFVLVVKFACERLFIQNLLVCL